MDFFSAVIIRMFVTPALIRHLYTRRFQIENFLSLWRDTVTISFHRKPCLLWHHFLWVVLVMKFWLWSPLSKDRIGNSYWHKTHYKKSVCIRSLAGPYFPTFALNMEIYKVNLQIQSKYWKMQIRKALNMTFSCAVTLYNFRPGYRHVKPRQIYGWQH